MKSPTLATDTAPRRLSGAPPLAFRLAADERLDARPPPARDAFASPFFQSFESSRRSLELTPGVVRDYEFPTFYADVTTGFALFLCDYGAAAGLLLDPGLKPVRAGLSTAFVAVSSYHYGSVRGLRPYNEVAVSLLVTDRGAFDVPPMGLLRLKGGELHAWVVAMPVTTLENQIRGREIWGLPKVVTQIDLRQIGDDLVTSVVDGDQLMLETRVPMTGARERIEQGVVLHSTLRGRPLTSRARSRGEFARRLNPGALFASEGAPPPEAPQLRLGTAKGAEALRHLRIRPVPLVTRFGRGVQSAFGLPEGPTG